VDKIGQTKQMANNAFKSKHGGDEYVGKMTQNPFGKVPVPKNMSLRLMKGPYGGKDKQG